MTGASRKIVILGGGMSGLTAAYELTNPARGGRYEVTVLQQGWRLGGKGASARNAARGHRIEEHGLHLWMGCYENAFRVIRDCYEELGRAPDDALATWRDAFTPRDTTVLMERHDGAWHPWVQPFPVLDNEPGASDHISGPLELTMGLVRWMLSAAGGNGDERFTPPKSACQGGDTRAGPALTSNRFLAKALGQLMELVEHGEARALAPALATVTRLLRVFRTGMAAVLRPQLSDPERRRLYLTLDFIVANAIGIMQDDLLIAPDGTLASYSQWLDNIQRIEHLDYRAWLGKHGCRTETLRSTIVRGLGDAVFNTGHDGAAGTALNGLIRLNLTFRGSVFWEMRAGMGETVFTPLYEVLKRRGVRFEFFSRVQSLRLDDDATKVEAIEVIRQAETLGGYQPLISVPHGSPSGPPLLCWPPEPLWEQLADADALRDTDFEAPVAGPRDRLEVLTDFDSVVLAISIAALPPITEELALANPRFADMLRALRTTRTQAAQLWFDRKREDLGFEAGPAVLTGYADPFDTWADMTHLGEVEHWGDTIKQCSYLCGSLDDDDVPGQSPAERVRATTQDWIEANMQVVLPKFATDAGVQWQMLDDPSAGVGAARLDAQYLRANTHPSERYVLSVPGSSRFRLRAHQSGFENLMLAGDWVKTGMNVGSIEAATMAGLGAARGITEDAVLIVGDFED